MEHMQTTGFCIVFIPVPCQFIQCHLISDLLYLVHKHNFVQLPADVSQSVPSYVFDQKWDDNEWGF